MYGAIVHCGARHSAAPTLTTPEMNVFKLAPSLPDPINPSHFGKVVIQI